MHSRYLAFFLCFIDFNLFASGSDNFDKAQQPSNQSLCGPNESTLFSCTLYQKSALLCLNTTLHKLQYQLETKSRIEFSYPQVDQKSLAKFTLSTTPYPGGGENRIRFTNGTYSYFLYDITKTQREKLSFNSIQKAGIVVYAKDKRVANLKCQNSETSIAPLAFETLQREEFSYDISTD